MEVSQIRVFPSDEIPFYVFQLPTFLKNLQELFHFQNIQPVSTGNLSATIGSVLIDGSEFSVSSLTLEPRRILITTVASSEISTKCYEKLMQILIESDHFPSSKSYIPTLVTEETVTVNTFSFSGAEFVSGCRMADFFDRAIELFKTNECNISIQPIGIKYLIKYKDLPEKLIKSNIQLTDKEVVIEARILTDQAERLFYVKTPSSSSQHIEILQVLDNLFKNE
jgi:hypothetical protein